MALYTKSITSGDSDAYLSTLGTWTPAATTLICQTNSDVYFRWPISIPKGSVITNAEIGVSQAATNSTAVTIRIWRLYTDDCPSLSTDQTALAQNTFVSWVAPSFTNNAGYVSTPNISDLIHDFIVRDSYEPGKHIGILFKRVSGAGVRTFYSYDGGQPAYISINFTPPKQKIAFSSSNRNGYNRKLSIIEVPDKDFLDSTKFVFTDGDGTSFFIRTDNAGVVGKKSPNVADAAAGYLEIDLPSRKFDVKIYDQEGDFIGETVIDQRPKGTYGRKTNRKDAGGVNLVDTTETRTKRGSTVISKGNVIPKKTARGYKIDNS